MAAGIVPVRYFCKACGWATYRLSSMCGRCGVIETEKISTPRQLGPSQQDEKIDPLVLGGMLADSASGLALPISSSNAAAVPNRDLDKPKKKKGLLGPDEKISPDNFATAPPSFSISLDRVEKKEMGDSKILGNVNDPKRLVDLSGKEAPSKKNCLHKHVNRRSRVYSWQFVNNVIMPNNDLLRPAPVIEEQVQVQARPAVKEIMKCMQMFISRNGKGSVAAIEEILLEEKRLGTPWREIADETIMELILKGVDAFKFISSLIKAYDIPPSDVGLFLATPPDEGTMSLIEEAVCQNMLGLFRGVLRMDVSLLKGLVSCKDTTEQVELEIFELLNNDDDLWKNLI